jgi:methenyltetrahydromethanopterin cyclohydrolase
MAARPLSGSGRRRRAGRTPPKVPASASRDYGKPFYEIFERYNKDFYKIDPLLFSPAEVWLTSVASGRPITRAA